MRENWVYSRGGERHPIVVRKRILRRPDGNFHQPPDTVTRRTPVLVRLATPSPERARL